jgi:hypothetical protein
MASNDQAILAKWSKQRDNEDSDEWRWRLGDLPNDICEHIVVWPTPPTPQMLPPQRG